MDRIHAGQQYTRTQIGTSIYMSPEALKGQRYGTQTDIWSLGATISFVCNRRHLFSTEEAVKNWPGGKSTLDRNKYSIEIRQLTANMMTQVSILRPNAEEIRRIMQLLREASKGNSY